VTLKLTFSAEHWRFVACVLAALVALAFAIVDVLSSRMSAGWSVSVKVLVFVVLAYLTLWCWPASRRRRGERRVVEPVKISSAGPRVDLVKVLQYQVRASSNLPLSTRIELREVLESLKSKDEDDTGTIAAWQLFRDAAPRIWDEAKPVRDALMGEAVKKALGLE
jgi:4-amino-4-deoxy-L-arabinose transferase-like glycosyltransferase